MPSIAPSTEQGSDTITRKDLLFHIWDMLPPPLRSEFLVFYEDATSTKELLRRKTIVEDVLFDFLAPINDAQSRVERVVSTGADCRDSGVFHDHQEAMVDWEVIKYEIIDRMLAVNNPINRDNYQGRGRAGPRGPDGGRPISPRADLRDPHGVIPLDGARSPIDPSKIRMMNKSWMNDAAASLPKVPSFTPVVDSPWQKDSITRQPVYYPTKESEESRYHKRVFTAALTPSAPPSPGSEPSLDDVEARRAGAHGAWTSKDSFENVQKGNRHRMSLEAIVAQREGARRWTDTKYRPSTTTANLHQHSQTQEKLSEAFWMALKWDNVNNAAEVLNAESPTSPETLCSTQYGTPFLQWMIQFLIRANGEEDAQKRIANCPDSIRASALYRMPSTCLFETDLEFKACETVYSIKAADRSSLDLLLLLIEALSQCTAAATIKARAESLSRLVLKGRYPTMDLETFAFPPIKGSPCTHCTALQDELSGSTQDHIRS